MNSQFPESLRQRLDEAEARKQRRHLTPRAGLDFSSNDYLGFSLDPYLANRVNEKLRGLPLGASGSRLIRGTLDIHERAEESLARYCGTEAALLFPSGYQANLGLLSALMSERDQVFSDASNHASIIDGIRLSRAQKNVFPHNDMLALREQLCARSKGEGTKFIVTESLFSMEGDFAPLESLVQLASEFGALLIVDESHATGVYGDFAGGLGGGLLQERGLRSFVFASVHTGGKALGVGGAWIAGSALLKDYLVNFSRPFIFSTAMVPAAALMLGEAVRYWSEVGATRATAIRARAQGLFEQFKNGARESSGLGQMMPQAASPILPVVLGSNERALAVSSRLRDCGFDVRAIRPPTVPEGTARLRVTVNWNTSEEEFTGFANRLFEILESFET